MKVYHGSYIEISSPNIEYSRENVDFGKGFYVTPYKEQAQNWASRFKTRKGMGIVSSFEFDLEYGKGNLSVCEFDGYNEAWIEFIMKCRRLEDDSVYDVVIGGVANDKVFNTIELYFEGLIDKSEALKRLRYEKPNMQICIRNQEVLDNYLSFVGSEVI